MAYNGSGAKGPVEFAEKVLGVNLWPIQREIMRAVESGRRVAVAGCHASSKTHTAACLALWFAARYADSRVLVGVADLVASAFDFMERDSQFAQRRSPAAAAHRTKPDRASLESFAGFRRLNQRPRTVARPSWSTSVFTD